MSVVLVIYDVFKTPDVSQERVLEYLGYFPELAGREYNGEVKLAKTGDAPLFGMIVYILDQHIHSENLHIVLKGFDQQVDEITKARVSKAYKETLPDALAAWFRMMGTQKSPVTSVYGCDACYTVEGNINNVLDNISAKFRNRLKVVEEANEKV